MRAQAQGRSSAANSDGSASRGSVFGRILSATRAFSRNSNGSSAPSRGRLAVLATALFALLALWAITASSALASKGIHDYFPKTSESGLAAGQFTSPQGVAVNETTGDIYVVDGANHRVQQFEADGRFIRMWGKDVNSAGGTGFEICEAATQDQCQKGVTGALGGELNFPRGIEVNQTTGDVYVTEQTNRRVQEFSSSGVWVRAWGKDVDSTGGTGFEVCTVAAQCKVGATGALGGEFGGNLNSFLALAPAGAPNAGDVIVPDPTNRRVQEFDSNGNFVRAFGFDVVGAGGGADNTGTGFEVCTQAVAGAANCKIAAASGSGTGQFATSQPTRVAVDSTGAIYTVEPAGNFRVQKFTPQVGPPALVPSVFAAATLSGTGSSNAPTDVAIGPGDNVFVVKAFPAGTGTPPAGAAERRILELDSSGTLQDTHIVGAGINFVNGLGADPSGTRLVMTSGSGGIHRVWVIDDSVAPTATIDPVTGIGVRTATFNGQVNPGNVLAGWHFEYSDNGIIWTSFPADDADAGNGTVPVPVSRTVPGRLKPNTAYQVRLVANQFFGLESATSGLATFTTLQAPPQIVEQVPAWVEQAKATLRTRIDPAGQATTYHFEWGPDPSDYAHRIPADHELFAGSGTDPVSVDANLSGLPSETQFYFRTVATNASGTATGGDQPFETLNDLGMMSGRRYELVSPPDKGLAGQAGEPVLGPQSHSVFATPDGNGVAFPIANAIPGANGGDEPVFRAQRGSDGWTSEEWSPPVSDRANNRTSASPHAPNFISRNLDCGFLASQSHLTDESAALPVFDGGGANLYRQAGLDEFSLVSNLTPTNPMATYVYSYQAYQAYGASESCDRVIFSTSYRYPGLDSTSVGAGRYLYQWQPGGLSDPAVIPGGSGPELAPTAVAGASGMNTTEASHNVVSEDGSRFFFTATSQLGGDIGQDAVFMREDDGTALDVSQSQTVTDNTGPSRFEMATPSGDFVFFKARYGLAPNGSSSGAPSCNATATDTDLGAGCDLYRYEADTGELLDLSLSPSVNPENTGGAAVGGVLDVSDDGSRAYFAAKGQLVAGQGQTYAENIGSQNPGYNIYLWDDGVLSFVATITQQDVTGGGGIDTVGLIASHSASNMGGLWSSDATPDGDNLVFLSRSNLTGYPAGVAPQAYIYSAADGALRCISCRRDGKPSIEDSLSIPLFHAILNDKASRYSSYLSDDGSRVFFRSKDALAPGAVSGETNYYEWQDGQVALLATDTPSLLHRVNVVTTTGGDDDTVFLSTVRGYVPWDTDGRRDVYAVRVGGGFAPPTPPAATPCDPLTDACQGGATTPPAAAAFSTANFAGAGNVAGSNRKRANKHRKCKKQKQQRKCKKQQRKCKKQKRKCKKQGNSKRGRK